MDLHVRRAVTIGAARADAATHPNPGVVTGAITGVRDAAMIKASNGTRMLASTGNRLEIGTSTDRTNVTRVGTAWASGQPTWTYPHLPSNNRSYRDNAGRPYAY
jgi:arabinan endo-1,5-alpha-L-arabinosidase